MRWALSLTVPAIALPVLVVHWVAVGHGVFAQGVAVMAWGLALAAWGRLEELPAVPWRALWPLLAALAAVAAGILWTWARQPAAAGPMLSALGLVVAAGVTAATAARLATSASATANPAALAWIAGVVPAA
jgi:hypothetical protein